MADGFLAMAAKIKATVLEGEEAKLQPRMKRLADSYAARPAEIRASIAKRAGVENKRLDDLSLSDRRRLKLECARLVNVLIAAHRILEGATTPRD